MLPKKIKDKIAVKFEQSKENLDNVIDKFILKRKSCNIASKQQMRKILDSYKEFMYAKDMSASLPQVLGTHKKIGCY